MVSSPEESTGKLGPHKTLETAQLSRSAPRDTQPNTITMEVLYQSGKEKGVPAIPFRREWACRSGTILRFKS